VRRFSLLVATLLIVAAVPATASNPLEDDPFPVGACVRATAVDRRPLCVMVDPDI
jgi:hypothetical protein